MLFRRALTFWLICVDASIYRRSKAECCCPFRWNPHAEMSNASTVETARSIERLINIVKRILFETRKQPRRQYTNTASFEDAVSDEMRLAISLQSQTIKPQYSPGAPAPPRFF